MPCYAILHDALLGCMLFVFVVPDVIVFAGGGVVVCCLCVCVCVWYCLVLSGVSGAVWCRLVLSGVCVCV